MSTTFTTAPAASSIAIDWPAMAERLVARFPEFPAEDVLTELVQAREAAVYVGTAQSELGEVAELMATYAMKVRSGEVVPSCRLDPERHATPGRADAEFTQAD